MTGMLLSAILTLGQDPTIRVSTRLVEVSVIVRDKDGPVGNLTKDDFTVLDRGKPQKIATFSVNSIRKLSKVAASVPTNIHTNRPEQRAESPTSVTVVLLDAINTPIQDQIYAKKQFVSFLGTIRPEDRVAVYVLGNRLRILNDFTTDSKALVEKVAKFRGSALNYVADSAPDPSNTGVTPDVGGVDLDVFLNDKNALLADYAIESRVHATVGAMEAIANHIGRLPGRKNLIWITGSFPFAVGQKSTESNNWNNLPERSKTPTAQAASTRQGAQAGSGDAYGQYGITNSSLPGNTRPDRAVLASFEEDVARATRALSDANIAVYPVDARGLITVPRTMTAESAGVSSRAVPNMRPPGIDSMLVMAERTGGRAFVNTNDIQNAIRTAIDDSEVTYTLGFYVDSSALDSSFHPIKVTTRLKNVDLRYRKGYIASPMAVLDKEAEINDALWSPLDASAISLAGSMEHKGSALSITVSVDTADLVYRLEGNERHGGIDFVFAQRSTDGRNLETIRQSITLDESQWKAMGQGLMVTKTIQPAPGVSEVRVILFDRISNRIGSLTIPVK